MELIRTALERKQKALSEAQSKKLIGAYGIPVTREEIARSADEAVALAQGLGYPVVLKACSPELMHKTEAGAVEIGLKSATEVREAYQRIAGLVRVPLEGILVQELVRGPRELVLGLTRDAQFGPCVMFGLGGLMTEILNDTVFRVAPLDAAEALEMMQEIRSKAILGPFRGQAAADLETLGRSLIALGQIGLENPAVAEIDINPVIVDPQGRVKAVDALVVLHGD